MSSILKLFSRKEKILLASLAFVQFSHIIDFIIIMPLGPKMIKIFDINPHQFGMLVSIYTLSAGFSGLAAAFFMDKFDRKTILQFFFVGFTLGTVACGLADSYSMLLFTRAVAGFFGGVLGSIILAIVSDKIDYSRRGTAMGILSTSFSLASILGLPFGLYLADRFSWHTPFFFLGGLCSIVSVILWFYTPSSKEHLTKIKDSTYSTSVFENFKLFFNNPNQRLSIIFMFFVLFGHFAIIPFISPSLVINAGFAENQLPFVYLFGGIASAITAPNIGMLSDHWGKHKVFTSALILSIIPILVVTHLSSSVPMWLSLIFTSSFFVFAGGRMIPAQAIVSEAAPTEVRGTFMSLVSCIQQFAMAAGSYVAGLIVVQEAGHLIHYPWVGYMAISSSLISLWLAWRIRTS